MHWCVWPVIINSSHKAKLNKCAMLCASFDLWFPENSLLIKSERCGALLPTALREVFAGIRRLDFLLVEGTELREGVDGIVGAIAADALVFTLVEDLDLGGAVGIGENLWFGFA